MSFRQNTACAKRGKSHLLSMLLAQLVACSSAYERPAAIASTDFAVLQARFPQAHLEKGRAVYMRQCVTCHQADGMGTGAAIPPLAGHISKFASEPRGKSYLARLGLYGVSGRIEVHGRPYYNMMPAQGLSLSDENMAGALNYALTQWGNDAGLVDGGLLTADDVAKERAIKRTPAENLALRNELWPNRVPVAAKPAAP